MSAIGAGSLDVCAVTLQGAATCWGDNAYGNLGDGSVTAHARPTAVYGIPSLPGPPVFGRMSPAKGAIDTRVVIKGKGLLGAMDVSFNGVDAGPPIVQSNKQIVIWVPSGATTGKVTITTPLGTVSSPHDFTVLP